MPASRPLLHFAAALALLGGARAGAAELVVIVSAKSPVAALRADQVADIFLGQSARYPGGNDAIAIDQKVGAPERDAFYARVAAKTPALVKAYWSKMIFTGRGQPPQEAPSGAAVRKLVADDPSLIGYIDKALLDASVKPVLVVQ